MPTLRDVWIERGMTSAQVAGQAGISVPTLYKMNRKEKGKDVKDSVILAVCKVLGISRADYEALEVCRQAERYRKQSQ